jgi:hypothetical protein
VLEGLGPRTEASYSTLSGLEPLLSIQGLVGYLDVPVTTIRDWRPDGKGPCDQGRRSRPLRHLRRPDLGAQAARGRTRALTRFGDFDGQLRRAQAPADTPKAAERKVKEEALAPSTRALYERDMRQLVPPAFEHYALREIRVRKVDQNIKTLAKTKSCSMAKQARTVLSFRLRALRPLRRHAREPGPRHCSPPHATPGNVAHHPAGRRDSLSRTRLARRRRGEVAGDGPPLRDASRALPRRRPRVRHWRVSSRRVTSFAAGSSVASVGTETTTFWAVA